MNGISVEDAKSALRASGARALAEALVLGMDECEQAGHPLTQVQQLSMATMAIMSYDVILEQSETLEALAVLGVLRPGSAHPTV